MQRGKAFIHSPKFLQAFFSLFVQFLRLFDELVQGVEAILAAGHMGVIVELAESCAESGEKQDEMLNCLLLVSFVKIFSRWDTEFLIGLTFLWLELVVKNHLISELWLMKTVASCPQAFHCSEPGSRHVTCLPLFMSLLTYEVYYHSDTTEGSAQTEVNL